MTHGASNGVEGKNWKTKRVFATLNVSKGAFLRPEKRRRTMKRKSAHAPVELLPTAEIVPSPYQARQTFDRYKKCTQTYCERWRSGVELDRLAVADRIERKS